MKATYNSDRNSKSAIITLQAREFDQKDIAHMERAVSYMVEQGYEEVYGDGNYIVTLGATFGETIEEMRQDYKQAKNATR